MKHSRYVSVLAVAALLVASPKAWAGYISGAAVFLDLNNNGLRDSGELGTTTNAGGNYSLSVDQSTAGLANARLRISGGTDRATSNAFTMTIPGVGLSLNQNQTTTIVAIAGTLTIKLGNGQSIKINPGSGTIIDLTTKQPIKDAKGNDIQSLTALLDSSNATDKQALIKGLTAAVESHAQQVASSTNAADAKGALTETAFMMKILAAAVPADTLSTIMTTAVTTLTKSGASTAVNTNAAISALIEGAKQGGASQATLITAADTGAKANSKGFTATDLQSAQNVNAVLVTTPVSIDVSIVSKSS